MKRKDILMSSLGLQTIFPHCLNIFKQSKNLKMFFHSGGKGMELFSEIEHTQVSILAKYLFQENLLVRIQQKFSVLSQSIRICVPIIKTLNFGVILYSTKYTYSLYLFFVLDFANKVLMLKVKCQIAHIKDKMKCSDTQKNTKNINSYALTISPPNTFHTLCNFNI